jgi:hypothetical protein
MGLNHKERPREGANHYKTKRAQGAQGPRVPQGHVGVEWDNEGPLSLQAKVAQNNQGSQSRIIIKDHNQGSQSRIT